MLIAVLLFIDLNFRKLTYALLHVCSHLSINLLSLCLP